MQLRVWLFPEPWLPQINTLEGAATFWKMRGSLSADVGVVLGNSEASPIFPPNSPYCVNRCRPGVVVEFRPYIRTG